MGCRWLAEEKARWMSAVSVSGSGRAVSGYPTACKKDGGDGRAVAALVRSKNDSIFVTMHGGGNGFWLCLNC